MATNEEEKHHKPKKVVLKRLAKGLIDKVSHFRISNELAVLLKVEVPDRTEEWHNVVNYDMLHHFMSEKVQGENPGLVFAYAVEFGNVNATPPGFNSYEEYSQYLTNVQDFMVGEVDGEIKRNYLMVKHLMAAVKAKESPEKIWRGTR